MNKRRIAGIPALLLAGLLFAPQPAAQAAPAAARTTAAAVSEARPAPAAPANAAVVAAPADRSSVQLAGSDKSKDGTKKGGFFKKLGIAVIVVIVLIILFAVALIALIIYAIRAIFRRLS